VLNHKKNSNFSGKKIGGIFGAPAQKNYVVRGKKKIQKRNLKSKKWYNFLIISSQNYFPLNPKHQNKKGYVFPPNHLFGILQVIETHYIRVVSR
jgi:hypothetical protein